MPTVSIGVQVLSCSLSSSLKAKCLRHLFLCVMITRHVPFTYRTDQFQRIWTAFGPVSERGQGPLWRTHRPFQVTVVPPDQGMGRCGDRYEAYRIEHPPALPSPHPPGQSCPGNASVHSGLKNLSYPPWTSIFLSEIIL